MRKWEHSFLILAFLQSIYFDISTEVHILLFDLLSIRITPSQPWTPFLTYFPVFLPRPKTDDEAVLNAYVRGDAGCGTWRGGKNIFVCQFKKMSDSFLLRNSSYVEILNIHKYLVYKY
jgi:hypothetical protein